MIVPVTGGIVVTAENFNPSIFSQLWFVGEGLAEAKDFHGNPSMSTPDLAQHEIGGIRVLVIPPKLDVSFPPDDDELHGRASRLVRKVTELLPHTPYQALGLNVIYTVRPEHDARLRDALRTLFVPEDSPLKVFFDSTDVRFGAYFSKDIFGGRLRLDVKPQREEATPKSRELVGLSFNLHFDLKTADRDTKLKTISGALGHFSELRSMAREILKVIDKAIHEG